MAHAVVLQATHEGLTDAEAQRRLGIYGPNSLPEKRRRAARAVDGCAVLGCGCAAAATRMP